jgi:hypothetical protein
VEIDKHEAAIEAGLLPAYCSFCQDTDYEWIRCEECGIRVCTCCMVELDSNGHLCPDCARKSVCEECGSVGDDHAPSCAFFGHVCIANALTI